MISDLNMTHENIVSFLLSWFTLLIKLRNFDFKSHRDTVIFFDKKIYDVRYKYVPWKKCLILLHFRCLSSL